MTVEKVDVHGENYDMPEFVVYVDDRECGRCPLVGSTLSFLLEEGLGDDPTSRVGLSNIEWLMLLKMRQGVMSWTNQTTGQRMRLELAFDE